MVIQKGPGGACFWRGDSEINESLFASLEKIAS